MITHTKQLNKFRLKNNWLIAAAIFASLGLSACSNPQGNPGQQMFSTTNVNGMQVDGLPSDFNTVQFGFTNIKTDPTFSQGQINKIRLKAIQDTATSLGARGALAWRAEQLDATLTQESDYLDRIFDFNSLMLPNNILPAVIVEADNLYTQNDPSVVHMASKTYKIEAAARFTTTPPTWRDYLPLNYSKPTLPDNSLLPKSAPEIGVWNQAYKNGWDNGLAQADMIFNQNLSRLKRDFNGIILYRKLHNENLVSAPFISKASLGITGDKNSIRINDRIMRITANSSINTDSNTWRPVITQNN